MQDVVVIEDAAAAAASLDPLRARLLRELATPSSASGLAAKVGLPRQKVNYHLRSLEEHGLVELVEERRKGNVMERVVQATAAAYVISPAALAAVQPDPRRLRDRFSAYWLLALASRMVQEVGRLLIGATAEQRQLATFAIDGEITFASAAARAAFAEELGAEVARLASKYHDAKAPGGRRHRLVVALHPSLRESTDTAAPNEEIQP
ncbi:helix-turn-helix domain-containing protein [Sinomonas sp. JGH33]|uniref:Helix-turn-helix domain-containing protein n=1 Tax=Sinomonas terricola TaxID=3110330 RepID=A0ABU5TBH0_9MICC|nr:helix-turn-helix domain-containing protein [Sinomonas sp. JGH33]MEA5457039.1 helix-turn-helix domain-containing protein [Sinomonas sp. JGH33]